MGTGQSSTFLVRSLTRPSVCLERLCWLLVTGKLGGRQRLLANAEAPECTSLHQTGFESFRNFKSVLEGEDLLSVRVEETSTQESLRILQAAVGGRHLPRASQGSHPAAYVGQGAGPGRPRKSPEPCGGPLTSSPDLVFCLFVCLFVFALRGVSFLLP